MRKNSVYHFPYEDGACYCGQTSRPISFRTKEHADGVRLQRCEKSHVAAHSWKHNTRPQFDQAQPLLFEKITAKRLVKEALLIRTLPDCVAKPSIDVPSQWHRLCLPALCGLLPNTNQS